jgi:hypothetical protein
LLTSTPRQSLKLDIALLEAIESDLEPAMKLEKWDELVTMAEPLQERGIQSMYLSLYGQAAATTKAYAEIDWHHRKLEAIEKTLERELAIYARQPMWDLAGWRPQWLGRHAGMISNLR